MADDVALVINDPLPAAAAIGNVATDFNGAVSTGGGGGGGGVVPPLPESFLHANAAANRNTNTQTPFFMCKVMFNNFLISTGRNLIHYLFEKPRFVLNKLSFLLISCLTRGILYHQA